MYLQCSAHFVVAEYISQLVEEMGGTSMCLVGHPRGQTHFILVNKGLYSVLTMNFEL